MQKKIDENSFRVASSFNTIRYEHGDENPKIPSNSHEPIGTNDDVGIASNSNTSGTSEHIVIYVVGHLLLTFFLLSCFH